MISLLRSSLLYYNIETEKSVLAVLEQEQFIVYTPSRPLAVTHV